MISYPAAVLEAKGSIAIREQRVDTRLRKGEVLLSAGGSGFYDRVVERFKKAKIFGRMISPDMPILSQ